MEIISAKQPVGAVVVSARGVTNDNCTNNGFCPK